VCVRYLGMVSPSCQRVGGDSSTLVYYPVRFLVTAQAPYVNVSVLFPSTQRIHNATFPLPGYPASLSEAVYDAPVVDQVSLTSPLGTVGTIILGQTVGGKAVGSRRFPYRASPPRAPSLLLFLRSVFSTCCSHALFTCLLLEQGPHSLFPLSTFCECLWSLHSPTFSRTPYVSCGLRSLRTGSTAVLALPARRWYSRFERDGRKRVLGATSALSPARTCRRR
jgi:hypothetical protein